MRSVVHKAYGQILETGTVKLFKSHRADYGDGEQVRDFVYVKDAVNVTLYFYDHPEVSGLFNCGTGKARSWNALVTAVYRAMGCEPAITYIDMPEHLREKYQYHTEADMTKLRAAGYDAPFFSLEDGITDYVQNYLMKMQR
jgi:ADP-L-glycero-D-manno-heptose 6-epimerase